MNIFSMQKIKLTYAFETIFEEVTLEVNEQEHIGIVGSNGSGKTTLLKILSGDIKPEKGSLSWKKGTTLAYLQQIPQFEDSKKIYNVMLEAFEELNNISKKMKVLELRMEKECKDEDVKRYCNLQEQFQSEGGYEMESNIQKISDGLGIKDLLDHEWKQLSGGERTKVNLGLLLLKEPDILLLDEPTNHLDLSAIEWLSQFLKGYRKTIVLVSHDRYFLDVVVNKVFEIENKEITAYHTNYTGYLKERDERIMIEFQQYKDQQKKIKKMQEAIKRMRDWANRANSTKMHRRATNMERALERIERLDKPVLQKRVNFSLDEGERSGDEVICMHNLTHAFSEKVLFSDLNLIINHQDRVALVGDNGSGKTTLLKIIMNELESTRGSIRHGANLSIGYLSQHAEELREDYTVIQEFRDKIPVSIGDSRRILAKFLFYGDSVFKKVSSLSGGEKMRLRWAEIVNESHNFLVLDEPTNHLDINTREVLEDSLEHFSGTILAVSHDIYFLDKFFHTTYWIENEKLIKYEGNYTDAKEKRTASNNQKI